jgi:hypothetical protein
MYFAFSLPFKSNSKLTDLQRLNNIQKKGQARSEQTRLHQAGPAQIGFAVRGPKRYGGVSAARSSYDRRL